MRKRYIKNRIDYRAGGRVELNSGGEFIGGGIGEMMRVVEPISAALPETKKKKTPFKKKARTTTKVDKRGRTVQVGETGRGKMGRSGPDNLSEFSDVEEQAAEKAAQDAANIEFGNIMAATDRPLSLFGFLSDVISGLPSDQGTQIRQQFGSETSPIQTALGFGSAALGIPGLVKDGGDMRMIEKGIMALQHGSKS